MQKSNEFSSNVCKNSNGITVLPSRIAIVLNCLNKTKVVWRRGRLRHMLMPIIANNHMELPNSHHHILKSCIHQHQCKSKHNQIKKHNLQKCHMLVCTPTMTKYEHDHNVTSIQYTKEKGKTSVKYRPQIQNLEKGKTSVIYNSYMYRPQT